MGKRREVNYGNRIESTPGYSISGNSKLRTVSRMVVRGTLKSRVKLLECSNRTRNHLFFNNNTGQSLNGRVSFTPQTSTTFFGTVTLWEWCRTETRLGWSEIAAYSARCPRVYWVGPEPPSPSSSVGDRWTRPLERGVGLRGRGRWWTKEVPRAFDSPEDERGPYWREEVGRGEEGQRGVQGTTGNHPSPVGSGPPKRR